MAGAFKPRKLDAVASGAQRRREAVEAGLREVAASGKGGGVLSANETMVRRYLAAGANFVAVGVDALLLANATSELLARYRPGEGAEREPARY